MTLNYDIDKEIRYLAMKLVESKGITKEEANVSYCDKNLLLEKPRQCRIMIASDCLTNFFACDLFNSR